ncbi:MAG: tetratricopeptide repeat protein [Tepidisphaeraceae bacterium]
MMSTGPALREQIGMQFCVNRARSCDGGRGREIRLTLVSTRGSILQPLRRAIANLGSEGRSLRTIKVFIASPGDLTIERRVFKDTIDELNKGFGRGADVEFKPLGWEDALSTVGRRAQSVINKDVDSCDVFFLVMWCRWGQKAPDAAKPATSYTEEEFNRAVERMQKTGAPSIHVFFKNVPQQQMADAGPQLKKVMKFRKKLERSKEVLYRGFADEKAFADEVRNHLISRGKDSPPPAELPSGSSQEEIDGLKTQLQAVLAELTMLRGASQKREKVQRSATKTARTRAAKTRAAELANAAKAESESLELAERAAKAALDGRIEEARQNFAKALDGTTNLRILYLGSEFFNRVGELDEAERLLKRWLAISGPDKQTADTAAALGNLGLIAQTRGDLDSAEDLHRESLKIERKLGRLEGQASDLGNLGLIAQARGQFESAERLHRESLDIERTLERLKGQAIQLGNLGVVAYERGEIDNAEALYKESLDIARKLEWPEGQACQIGNLGLIAMTRGDLDTAEKLGIESLGIERSLGRLEGQADDLDNLGTVAKKRGDHAKARRLWTESLSLYAKLGLPQRMQEVQKQINALPSE